MYISLSSHYLKGSILIYSWLPWNLFSASWIHPCIFTVCKTLVLPRILEKLWFPHFFSAPKTKLVLSLKVLQHFLHAKFKKLLSLYKYHYKNTLYYQLSMVCTINVQKGCVLCCHRQIFKEIYANLSLKSLFTSLSIPTFNFFSGFPLFEIFKIWVPLHPFERGDTL